MRSTLVFFACLYATFQCSTPTASIYGTLECEEDSDCLAADAYCDSTRLCECPSGFVFSTNGSLCLQYVTEYNGDCMDSEQCAWLQGKYACLEGLCTCDEGWRWYQGRCIQAKALKESCSRDLDCYNGYDVFAMSCINGTCQCSSDYYLRGDYDCRPASYSEDDECVLDTDCRFEGATCQNARCKTTTVEIELEVPNKIDKRRSIILDVDCESNSDCSDINNSVCSPLTKKCICKRGYFYESTGCVGELGVHVGCASDSDCPIKPGSCIDGTCYCSRFRYYGDANRRCYKSMTQTNWNCTSDEWCFALGTNAYCNSERRCACSSNAELDENYVCQITEASETPTDGCQSDSDCSDVANSQCVDQKCVCKDNYREEDGSCLPNIGAICDDSSPCTIADATCDAENVCSCSDGYVSDGSVSCLASASEIGDECIKPIQCDNIVNTECADGRCSCIENFSEYNGACYEIKVMGSYCANRFQCSIFLNETVECRNSKCQCAVGYTSTDDSLGCKSAASSFVVGVRFYLGVVGIFIAVIIFE